MKRSEVNRILESAVAFLHEMHFHLPPFAYWSLEEWRTKGPEYAEIKDNMLGWDITDFGSGDFAHVGLSIFTLRNGNLHDPRYVKPYCEKILIQDEGQVLPFHFHWKKMEDIINRGGGNLMVQLYNSLPDGEYADTPVEITTDGHRFQVEAGGIVRVSPGESITLMPGQYHCFWAEEGTGRILLGEVSTVNDDRVDNRFHDYGGRLPDIEEDEKPRYLLFKDYEALERLYRLYL
jgi:D-lyxose ketol-isomerase